MMAIALAFWDAVLSLSLTVVIGACIAYLMAPTFLGITTISSTAITIVWAVAITVSAASFFKSLMISKEGYSHV